MRDYLVGWDCGLPLMRVADIPTPELHRHLAAITSGESRCTGVNGAATREDVAERIRIEFDIRAMGLRG